MSIRNYGTVSQSGRTISHSSLVLICFSLITNEIEQLFLCYFGHSDVFRLKDLLVFCFFPLRCFVFVLLVMYSTTPHICVADIFILWLVLCYSSFKGLGVLFVFAILGVDPRALCLIGKCSITSYILSPFLLLFYFKTKSH